MRIITLIVIHQSASNNPAHDNIETINKWHLERGFSEVGYAYFIRKDGTIEKGRDEAKIGAHVKGHNKSSVGICLSGQGPKTPEQLNSLEILLIELCGRLDLEKQDIVGHSDLAPTECPGFDLHLWLSGLSWH